MTLYSLINELLDIAKNQPNINYVGEGDIYSLNSKSNLDYSLFFITQTNHSLAENTHTYNLVLYYIDRLLADDSNRLQVQSQAILEITNIVNLFNAQNEDIQIDYNIDFTTFIHKFQDNCAGAFANVTITADAELGICGY